jgi:hypothetical protein
MLIYGTRKLGGFCSVNSYNRYRVFDRVIILGTTWLDHEWLPPVCSKIREQQNRNNNLGSTPIIRRIEGLYKPTGELQ